MLLSSLTKTFLSISQFVNLQLMILRTIRNWCTLKSIHALKFFFFRCVLPQYELLHKNIKLIYYKEVSKMSKEFFCHTHLNGNDAVTCVEVLLPKIFNNINIISEIIIIYYYIHQRKLLRKIILVDKNNTITRYKILPISSFQIIFLYLCVFFNKIRRIAEDSKFIFKWSRLLGTIILEITGQNGIKNE